MSHISEEQLVLYFYKESENPAAISKHLEGCPTCQRRYDRLNQVLAGLREPPIPDLPEDYGKQVWQRLRPMVTEPVRPSGRLRGLLQVAQTNCRALFRWAPGWSVATALGLALLAAFYLGRTSAQPPMDVAALRHSIEETLRTELRQELDARIKSAVAGSSRSDEKWTQFVNVYAKHRTEDRRDLMALRRDLETLVIEADNRIQLTRRQIGRLVSVSQPGPASSPGAITQ